MSEIRAGDVVVCVNAAPDDEWAAYLGDPNYTRLLKLHAIYRALRIVHPAPDSEGFGIILAEEPNRPEDEAWAIERFRKVEPADELFTEQMRACRPAQKQVPVHARGEQSRGEGL